MFDFTRRVKLAAGDTIRRVALKAAAGLVAVAGSGFLVAALWSFLATELDWGAALASLTIGGVLVVIAAILIGVSSRQKHTMPTGDDLKREMQARVSTATEAAVGRVRAETTRVVELAETKAHSLMDNAGSRVTQLASDAESKMFGGLRDAAQAVGLGGDRVAEVKDQVRHGAQTVREASNTNLGSMAKLFGAFAVGITLAAKIQESRNRDPIYDPAYDPDDFI